jgi:predicted NUDIX family NTP pyrophosphohydrolase
MSKQSAGLLMFRRCGAAIEVLLVHPGGPFWKNKDEGAWTFPRGEVEPGEELEAAARREFHEETGHSATGKLFPLGSVRQKSGKTVHAWASEGDLDPTIVASNTFTMEWPPKSGKQAQFPEIDRAEFIDLGRAREKIRTSEIPLLENLERITASNEAQTS